MTWWMKLDRLITPQRIIYAWITGAILWAAWLTSIILGGGKLDLAGQVVGTDYIQFYAAGTTVLRGESARLYDFEYQSMLEQEIAGPELTNFHAFITPPFLAWLFVPFSLLPYTWSFTLWSVLGFLFLFTSLELLDTRNRLRTVLLSLTWFPVFACISFGQNSLLSLLIISLIFTLWQRQKPLAAGLVCSLLLYKPQLVLGIALLWILEWKRNWKAISGLMIGGGILAGLTFWLMPEASIAYLKFSRTVLPGMINWNQFPLYHAHTFRAFWTLLFPDQKILHDILTTLCDFLGLIGFIWLWRNYRGEPRLLFAGAICLTLWITPHAMIYDWVILLIPAFIIWQDQPEHRTVWKGIYAIIWVATFLSGPLTYLQLKILPLAVQISVPIYAILLYSATKLLQKRSHDSTVPQFQV